MQGPLVLMVLDGWGMREGGEDNAITTAPARHFFELWQQQPHSYLEASGEAVGLMPGQMGDSNVGHLTLGAGRVIRQNLSRIFRSIHDGSFYHLPRLLEFLDSGRRLHMMGLVSPGGVHSHQEHLKAILETAKRVGVPRDRLFVHAWLDGRDVPPESADQDLAYLESILQETQIGRIATVAGRYYAMDRDKRWDRIELAYRAMVEGKGPTAASAREALAAAYQSGTTDEFVVPTVIVRNGEPVAQVAPEDAVLVFNFRADRVRQITRAVGDPKFDEFERPFPSVAELLGMTVYDEDFPFPALFDPVDVPHNLAEWLADHGVEQLHVAETEKYAHVTYFFNGGVERQYPGEHRELVPSPKVKTYDLKPEMGAPEICDVVLRALTDSTPPGFILLNFANSDMVGHTGDLDAAQAAVRTVDEAIGRIYEAVAQRSGVLAIVADHGNAECMKGEDGANTNHTTNPVPFVLAGPAVAKGRLENGELSDVAPTLLSLLGLEIPREMTGRNLYHSS